MGLPQSSLNQCHGACTTVIDIFHDKDVPWKTGGLVGRSTTVAESIISLHGFFCRNLRDQFYCPSENL